MSDENKRHFCKDCVYFIESSMQCSKFPETDLVTGKAEYPPCVCERTYGHCKKEGHCFQQRPPHRKLREFRRAIVRRLVQWGIIEEREI